MKYLTICILTLCLLLSSCSAVGGNDVPPESSTQQNEQATPDADVPARPETPPPAGTDSNAPPPAEGPEGLPTPAL